MASSGYAAWSVVADEQPTAAKWNILGSNDASFNNGNGFEDNIIVNRHVANAAITSNEFKPTVIVKNGDAAARFTTSSTGYVDVPNMDVVYTAPADCAIKLLLWPSWFITAGASAQYARFTSNGVAVANSEIYVNTSQLQTISKPSVVDVAAGQTVTIRTQTRVDGGTGGVVNEGTINHPSKILVLAVSNA